MRLYIAINNILKKELRNSEESRRVTDIIVKKILSCPRYKWTNLGMKKDFFREHAWLCIDDFGLEESKTAVVHEEEWPEIGL